MGGQQFATDSICIDTRSLDRVVSFDQERGLIEVEAGIQWPKLIRAYLDAQGDSVKQWGIAQKQTGADTFTLGGSLSSNVHGRGLAMKPLISNIESFALIDADGKSIRCSRNENNELFRHVLGGYGLFGVILDVDLDVVPNEMYERKAVYMDYKDFPKYYREQIEGNETIGLTFGRLSVSPTSYLREAAVHVYTKTPSQGTPAPLEPGRYTALGRFVINFSKTGGIGRCASAARV